MLEDMKGGCAMLAKIQKWGNSLAIRIPKPFALEIGLEQNSLVTVSIEEG